MKKTRFFLAFFLGLAITLAASAGRVQGKLLPGLPAGRGETARALPAGAYTVEWSTLDGGGGQAASSAAGNYTLDSTLAQPDAGLISGGTFTLEGGFWPGPQYPWQIALPLLIR